MKLALAFSRSYSMDGGELMGLSIVKSFSILVASGNGDKCNTMRAALRNCLVTPDSETGLSKIFLHKNCKKDPKYKDDCLRISKEVGGVVQEILNGVPAYFYCADKKINLAGQN